jgi:hypothetical protein
VLVQEFKFDFNAYLAQHPAIPVRSLEQGLTSGIHHPALEQELRNSQNTESLDTKEYLEHFVKRTTLKQAILSEYASPLVRRALGPAVRIGNITLGSHVRTSS